METKQCRYKQNSSIPLLFSSSYRISHYGRWRTDSINVHTAQIDLFWVVRALTIVWIDAPVSQVNIDNVFDTTNPLKSNHYIRGSMCHGGSFRMKLQGGKHILMICHHTASSGSTFCRLCWPVLYSTKVFNAAPCGLITNKQNIIKCLTFKKNNVFFDWITGIGGSITSTNKYVKVMIW